MPHNIVNGFCESGCKVPVKPAAQVEDLQHGGTGAQTGDEACENIGAVKKSGDTMTGALVIDSTEDEDAVFSLKRTLDDDNRELRFYIAEDGTAGMILLSNDEIMSRISLRNGSVKITPEMYASYDEEAF